MMQRGARCQMLPGSRVLLSPSNPALGVVPRAFGSARNAIGIA